MHIYPKKLYKKNSKCNIVKRRRKTKIEYTIEMKEILHLHFFPAVFEPPPSLTHSWTAMQEERSAQEKAANLSVQ